jgi:hypothetical protein
MGVSVVFSLKCIREFLKINEQKLKRVPHQVGTSKVTRLRRGHPAHWVEGGDMACPQGSLV